VKFPNNEAERVINTFQRFIKGKAYDLDRYLGDASDEHNRQQATCWVDGILPVPFHPIGFQSRFPWSDQLESETATIQQELRSYLDISANKASESWMGSRNEAAGSTYGPQWQTLGLMDRGLWLVYPPINSLILY
jgi:hypothetical protein